MEDNKDMDRSSKTERSSQSLKDTLKSGSPDEVKDRVKETVEKGVAAVAGALKGFNRATERNRLPEETKGAIHQAAETAKSTVSSVTEEVSGLREPLREAGEKLGDAAREMSSTLREEVDRTRSAVEGAGSSGTGAQRASMGMGGSELGATPGGSASRASSVQGSELPDISRTPLAESDSKLMGKDLTKDLEE